MSRASLADDHLNNVVEEALGFAADIKDMVARAKPGILESLEFFEAFAQRFASPGDLEETKRRCAAIRQEFANAELEANRYEQAVRLKAPRAGYPYLLKEKGA